ncbi:MAG: hypothetical protein M3O71_10020 [Bacteroidota bacterium]|nr:hypothetical protein [Bacteroidota bacterium]
MNKLRQPPIFNISETDFLVDIDKQVLRQTNDLNNEISFIKDMTDRGTHYRLFYDPARKNIPRYSYEKGTLLEITVPKLSALDPEGMSEKYRIPVGELPGKTDFEVIVDQRALYQRLNGILPQLDLAGEQFAVDLRNHELRHSRNSYEVISLKSFDISNDGWHFEAYYHPVMKKVVEIDPKLLEFPESVIKIRIPNEIGLDPVGAARQYGIDERELLRRHPIQVILKAEIIPLSETNIPGMIQRNKEALKQEHRENMQRAKPRIRPRF